MVYDHTCSSCCWGSSKLPGNSSVYFSKYMKFNLRVITAASGDQLNQRKRKGIPLTWQTECTHIRSSSGSHRVTFMPASVSRWSRCARHSLTVSSRCGQLLVNNREAVIFTAGHKNALSFADEWLICLQMAKSQMNSGVTSATRPVFCFVCFVLLFLELEMAPIRFVKYGDAHIFLLFRPMWMIDLSLFNH